VKVSGASPAAILSGGAGRRSVRERYGRLASETGALGESGAHLEHVSEDSETGGAREWWRAVVSGVGGDGPIRSPHAFPGCVLTRKGRVMRRSSWARRWGSGMVGDGGGRGGRRSLVRVSREGEPESE
jgi:hypothetical protein